MNQCGNWTRIPKPKQNSLTLTITARVSGLLPVAKHWSDRLVSIGACSDAVAWAKTQPTFRRAWLACDRGDWMLWLLDKNGLPRERLVSIALIEEVRTAGNAANAAARTKVLKQCADIVRKHVPKPVLVARA